MGLGCSEGVRVDGLTSKLLQSDLHRQARRFLSQWILTWMVVMKTSTPFTRWRRFSFLDFRENPKRDAAGESHPFDSAQGRL